MLTSLNLEENKLGPIGGNVFAHILCNNTMIKDLNLCNNKLGFDGGKALTNSLFKNTTLTSLNLLNNGISLIIRSINPGIKIMQKVEI